ncbi:MAG TPA: aminoglycoside adenylyltransferase domain-containing protein [Candidatus Limnocylindrales bacterium]|nr:aminoglycoside adenylyltransferase domain-containing protein [Candidatus Limnocylindrales bacterium]
MLATEDAQLAGTVVAILLEVFGGGAKGDDEVGRRGAVVGVYLHGSAVLGGLRPSSDLDILAVVDRPTTADERRSVVNALLEISGRRAYRGPARPVELTIVTAQEVRPWRHGPIVELLYGEWLRDAFERGEVPTPASMPDLGPEIALALRGNWALVGPPPALILDDVPAADLRRAIVAGVPSLLADLESDTRNVLLTFARIWFTLETGIIGSKDEAAAWALERLPDDHEGVLNRARELYLDGADIDWTAAMPAAIATAEAMLARIERLSRSGGTAST